MTTAVSTAVPEAVPEVVPEAAGANLSHGARGEGRVRGLDTLRFFLALWVIFGHLGFIPVTVDEGNLVKKIAATTYGLLFSGPAAVIVFFVISGFCIHYSYRHSQTLHLTPYFARRHLRIWVPIIVAALLANPLGVELSLLQDSILWSLVAEEIYYLIYPALLFLRRKIGWGRILFVSYVCAFGVILTNPFPYNYPSYGPYLNWVLGLPCWLLGCCLAERADALCASAPTREVRIWRWRFTAWFLSWLASALTFHTPFKNPWTLTLFAVFAFFWLQQEIMHFQKRAPIALFESLGKGSYSMYLVHLLGPALYAYLSLPVLGPKAQWLAHFSLTMLLCFLFYLAVERPSHRLARGLAQKLSPQVVRSARHAA